MVVFPQRLYRDVKRDRYHRDLCLFVVAFFGAQVGLRRIRKYGPDLLTRRMALYTHLALIVATLCAFFLTLGYSGLIWVLIGVSGTFQLAVARQAKLAQTHQGNHVPMTDVRLGLPKSLPRRCHRRCLASITSQRGLPHDQERH